MDVVALLGVLLAGLALGAVVGAWIVRRSEGLTIQAAVASAGADAQAKLAAAHARIEARDHELRDLAARLDDTVGQARDAGVALGDERVTRAGLEAALRDERERSVEKLALLNTARDELSAHFRSLAGDALELNRQRMSEQHHGVLDAILKPLGEKLTAFEKKVEDTYDKEAQQRASLRQEVLNLQAATLQINEDAKNLTRALKGEAKTRGNWGEVVLERVLERSGLRKGHEYHAQHSMTDDDGAVSRPDIVIRLPEGKHVIIDSKVSLVAYDGYHAAVDELARSAAGKSHVEGMRRHAKQLGDKNYQGSKEVDSPDFVAMFVPIEPAFSLASSLDADLFLDAWERKVVIVTPSTLLALLMTVQSLWRRDNLARSALEIAEESGKLHDQFVLVIESLQTLGRGLKNAQDAFEETEKRLVDGRGNLVGRIRKLQDMGARTKRQLPPTFLERAGAADEPESDAAQSVQTTLTLVVGKGESSATDAERGTL